MARGISQNVSRATGTRGFDNLALSRRKGSRVASSGALHLAGDGGARRAQGRSCPFGLGSSDLSISRLVRLKLATVSDGVAVSPGLMPVSASTTGQEKPI